VTQEEGSPCSTSILITLAFPGAAVAQLILYGSRIVPFGEEHFPLLIGGPSAVAAVVPAVIATWIEA
jgi:hypothetical protein